MSMEMGRRLQEFLSTATIYYRINRPRSGFTGGEGLHRAAILPGAGSFFCFTMTPVLQSCFLWPGWD